MFLLVILLFNKTLLLFLHFFVLLYFQNIFLLLFYPFIILRVYLTQSLDTNWHLTCTWIYFKPLTKMSCVVFHDMQYDMRFCFFKGFSLKIHSHRPCVCKLMWKRKIMIKKGNCEKCFWYVLIRKWKNRWMKVKYGKKNY